MIMEFLQNNYEWVFSGLGTSILFWLIGYNRGFKKCLKQKMKVNKGGQGIQAGGDVNIGGNKNV